MPEYCVTTDLKEVEEAVHNGQTVKAWTVSGIYLEVFIKDAGYISWATTGNVVPTWPGREFRIYPLPQKEYTFFEAKEYTFFEALELAKKDRERRFVRKGFKGLTRYGFCFNIVGEILTDLQHDVYNVTAPDLDSTFVEVHDK